MNSAPPEFHAVCHVADVVEGQARLFVVAETMIGVFNVQGRFYALAKECPHAGASLAHGIVEGDCVRCRIHHWRFSIREGTYLDEDRPYYNAQPFPVRVIGDEVQVAVSR